MTLPEGVKPVIRDRDFTIATIVPSSGYLEELAAAAQKAKADAAAAKPLLLPARLLAMPLPAPAGALLPLRLRHRQLRSPKRRRQEVTRRGGRSTKAPARRPPRGDRSMLFIRGAWQSRRAIPPQPAQRRLHGRRRHSLQRHQLRAVAQTLLMA